MRLLVAAAALTLTLAACGEERARAPGAVSEGEAKALEQAATMLDQRRLPPQAVPDGAAPREMTGDSTPPSGE